jgi:hypothetical protein
VAQIATEGKDFNWNRPLCSCGSKKVWGHGFVTRFFAGYLAGIFLKRFRCPDCRTVFTMLPEGYGRRLQTRLVEIAEALVSRLEHRGWPRALPRQRAGHWLRKFLKICQMNFPEDDPLLALDRLRGHGIHFFDQEIAQVFTRRSTPPRPVGV